jgi:hypothetical protein
VNLPTKKNDGHEWTVSEDWEARTGIQNDIFQIESLPTYDALRCVPQSEAVTLAWETHWNQGHFHRDNVKIALMDKIASPHLDQSITKAIMDCGKCKGHGPKHLHSLLEPITRCHPFELLVGDTMSMPKEKRGFTKIRLYVDVYSQHIWADKIKTSATAATTCKTFNNICTTFTAPEAFMVDGGHEFDNDAVCEACTTRNVEL